MQLNEAIRVIKERLSLVDIAGRYIQLRRNGPRHVAPCPFHQETRPSFSINEEKGLFYCFGCQASGDLIEFYARINGLDFNESVAQLAEQAGVSIDKTYDPRVAQRLKNARTEKQAMLAMHEEAVKHFKANLNLRGNEECLEYIKHRGISPEILKHFEIGWAQRNWHALESLLLKRGYNPELAIKCGLLGKSKTGESYDRFRGRLMFPIRNLSSQAIAFGGRIIGNEDEAKYINSSDTPIYGKKEHLYGLLQARRSISAKGKVLLTEGYMDVLTLHQFGYDNSVGVLGTALTEEQIHRLSGFTSSIDLLFDGDRAGRKAALRASELLLCKGLSCKVILLPEGEDIDSLLKGAGCAEFDKLHAQAPDGASFCIATIRELAPREALSWAREFLNKVKIPELTSYYASLFSQKLGITENSLRSDLERPKARNICISVPTEICDRDMQILLFAVRYPERLTDLREIGADLALVHKSSHDFWKLLEIYSPDEIMHYMNEEQKKFWIEKRGPTAPPRTSADAELACLKEELDRFYVKTQAQALQAALAGAARQDFSTDLEYLQVFRDAMRKKNEQS